MYKIFANTLFTGQQLIFVPECHSTNSLATELAARSSLPGGTVIITNRQTAGRGQRGNMWESEPEMNLTFSIVLKPLFLFVHQQFFLNIITALAIADLLKKKSVEKIKIKWPNDVLVNKKKICGILIENSIQKESIQQSIVGIGLNINQKKFANAAATSLINIIRKPSDLNECLNLLLENFEQRFLQLRSGKFDQLKSEYLQNLFGLGDHQSFLVDDQRVTGIIEDVDEHGQLIVTIDDEKRKFRLKEIHFIMDEGD